MAILDFKPSNGIFHWWCFPLQSGGTKGGQLWGWRELRTLRCSNIRYSGWIYQQIHPYFLHLWSPDLKIFHSLQISGNFNNFHLNGTNYIIPNILPCCEYSYQDWRFFCHHYSSAWKFSWYYYEYQEIFLYNFVRNPKHSQINADIRYYNICG